MKRRILSKKKTGIRGILVSIPAIIVLAIVLFFLARGVITMIIRSHDAGQKLEEERLELDRARERHDALLTDLDILRTDFGKEELLRKKYDVVLPGEEVIKLIGSEESIAVVIEEDSSWFGVFFKSIASWFRD